MTGPGQPADPEEPVQGPWEALWAALARLMRDEWRLARAEVSRAAGRMRRGLALLALGAVLALVAVQALAQAATAGLQALGLGPALAGLAVGVGFLALALGMLRLGAALVNPGQLWPRRSLARLSGDLETLKSMVTQDATDANSQSGAARARPDRGRD